MNCLILHLLLFSLIQISAFTIWPAKFAVSRSFVVNNAPRLSDPTDNFSRCSFAPGSRVPMDVKETEESFKLMFDLPGVSKDNIYVGVDEGILTVKASRQTFKEEESNYYRRVERSSGEVCRCMSLPKSVDVSKIDAEYVDGILTVDVRKFTPEELNAKVIRVSVK